MIRVKRGIRNNYKRKKIFILSKGFRGRRKNVFRVSKQAVLKSFQYSYIDRKNKKRFFKKKWILNINQYVKKYNLNYSNFHFYIKFIFIKLNLKILNYLIIYDKYIFNLLLEKIFSLKFYKNKFNDKIFY